MEMIIENRKGENFTVLYDDCDHDLLMSHKWRMHRKGYAIGYPIGSSSRNTIFMHRLILSLAPKIGMVDHINLRKLDNRRLNLRLCTVQQNNMNVLPRGKSKFLGVHFSKPKNIGGVIYGPYIVAEIRIDGKSKHLGNFKTEEAAARAYDAAARIHHKEFANLNFPDQQPATL